MTSRFIIALLIAFAFTTVFADDAIPQGSEVRGFVGLAFAPLPKQAFAQPPNRPNYEDFRIIYDVVSGSPAELIGIKPNDYILAVDGRNTNDLKSLGDLVHILQGAPDTVLHLELKRASDGRVETVSVTRAKRIISSDYPK